MGETGFCKNLQFGVVFCQYSAVLCEHLRLPNPVIPRVSRDQQKSLELWAPWQFRLDLHWNSVIFRDACQEFPELLIYVCDCPCEGPSVLLFLFSLTFFLQKRTLFSWASLSLSLSLFFSLSLSLSLYISLSLSLSPSLSSLSLSLYFFLFLSLSIYIYMPHTSIGGQFWGFEIYRSRGKQEK